MFKSLGLIESYGSGVGKAKEAMKENGSPEIHYEEYGDEVSITSVRIPVNPEYAAWAESEKAPKEVDIGGEKADIAQEKPDIEAVLASSGLSNKVKGNICLICEKLAGRTFGRSDVMSALNCSTMTATGYIKKMNELSLLSPVKGLGKGKYRFLE